MRVELLIIGSFAAAGVLACASVPAPRQELTQSKSAIRAAEELQADEIPQASLHLKLARDQVKEAERLIEDDDNAAAKQLLDRARVDADLAVALAHAGRQASEAQEESERVQELRQQIEADEK